MTAGFCARLLGMYPCRLSKKIIAFCSGCGWILPVILIAIAALPGFCQQYVHREITLCVGRHTSITIPPPQAFITFDHSGEGAATAGEGGTNDVQISGNHEGTSTIRFKYDYNDGSPEVIVVVVVKVIKCPEAKKKKPPDNKAAAVPVPGGKALPAKDGGKGVAGPCPSQEECDKLRKAYEAAKASGDAGKAWEAYDAWWNCDRARKACPQTAATAESPKEPEEPKKPEEGKKSEETKTETGTSNTSATSMTTAAISSGAIATTTAVTGSSATAGGAASSNALNVATNANMAFAGTLPADPDELAKNQLTVVIILIPEPPTTPRDIGAGPVEILGPNDLELRLDSPDRAILARGPWELATLNTGPPFALESGTASWMAAPLPSAPPAKVVYSLVANGNSAGEAFELQVLDPDGQFKTVVVPEGLVLQPAAPPPKKPAKPAGAVLKQPVAAVCLEEAKQPPAAGMLYKIADAAIQQRYKPVRYLLAALRKLAANGQLHPDSALKDYALFLQQYGTWAQQGGWNEQQFTEHWIEHTKKVAQAMHRPWTQKMEDTLRAAAPNRWRDINRALQEAESMMRSESSGVPS